MKLPNGDRAVVDIAKLRDYCLNPEHPRGRHKARVFASALGIGKDQADELREALLQAAADGDAVATDKDEYGQRFVLDFTMRASDGRSAIVRSSWIILTDDDLPRLTSCYVT